MSVWTRLFGRSQSSQLQGKPRLGLESLEMREVPAVIGGDAICTHEFGHGMGTSSGASVPVVSSGSLVGEDGTIDPLPASDFFGKYAFDGIKGNSAPVGPSEKLAADPAKPERDASPLPVLMVIADRQDFYSAHGAGRDVLIADQTGDRAPTSHTAADDVWVDGKVITGQNYESATIANSGYIRIKKLNSGG